MWPRVLFLDVDGVLNSWALFKRRKGIETHPATPTEKKRIKEIKKLAGDSFYPGTAARIALNLAIRDLRSIDPVGVAFLNDLLARSGAKVVVSSTWRKWYPPDVMAKVLSHSGFTGEVIGATPYDLPRIQEGPYATSYPLRGHEIQHWLDSQSEPPTHFVILDDDTDMAHLSDRLVRTDMAVGLTRENVEQALRLFGETP